MELRSEITKFEISRAGDEGPRVQGTRELGERGTREQGTRELEDEGLGDESKGTGGSLLWFGFGSLLAFFIFVRSEVFGLFAEEALGFVGYVLAGFNGLLAREIEWAFAGESAQSYEPVLRLVSEGLEGGAHVGVTFGVLIEVGSKLVHKVGAILEFPIEAGGAGIGLGAVGENLDGVYVLTDELSVELDAFVGIDAGFADLIDLRFSEGVVVFLGGEGNETERQSERECGKC